MPQSTASYGTVGAAMSPMRMMRDLTSGSGSSGGVQRGCSPIWARKQWRRAKPGDMLFPVEFPAESHEVDCCPEVPPRRGERTIGKEDLDRIDPDVEIG